MPCHCRNQASHSHQRPGGSDAGHGSARAVMRTSPGTPGSSDQEGIGGISKRVAWWSTRADVRWIAPSGDLAGYVQILPFSRYGVDGRVCGSRGVENRSRQCISVHRNKANSTCFSTYIYIYNSPGHIFRKRNIDCPAEQSHYSAQSREFAKLKQPTCRSSFTESLCSSSKEPTNKPSCWGLMRSWQRSRARLVFFKLPVWTPSSPPLAILQ